MNHSKPQDEKTTPEFWDSKWGSGAAVVERGDNFVVDSILDFFDEHVSAYRNGKALEIGGAPGRYLGRLTIDHELQANAIDYSPVGCEKLKSNFKNLNRRIEVIERNVLEVDANPEEKYDVVFSLGLIEHFEPVDEIIERHVQYLSDDGILILGVPNCRGIYHWFWKTLSPDLLSKHVLSTMEKKRWFDWEKKFGLKATQISYVGGFDALSLDKHERSKFHWKRPIARAFRVLFNPKRNILKHLNSQWTSGYLIGAFKKST